MEIWRSELYHFGVKGMKWGVRRYRNKDGTLTSNGKNRYTKNRTLSERNAVKPTSEKRVSNGRLATSGALGIIGSSLITGIAATAAYKLGEESLAKNLAFGGVVMNTVIATDTVSRMRKNNWTVENFLRREMTKGRGNSA